MNAIVIAHVPVAELPLAWRQKLGQMTDACVTVRIETENEQAQVQSDASFSDDALFGMWRDRQDMIDVDGYVRHIRSPRFSHEDSRHKP
jgi:hypothetical protein